MQIIDHWEQAGNWCQQWITLRQAVALFARQGNDTAAATLLGAIDADAERLSLLRAELIARLGTAANARMTEGRTMNLRTSSPSPGVSSPTHSPGRLPSEAFAGQEMRCVEARLVPNALGMVRRAEPRALMTADTGLSPLLGVVFWRGVCMSQSSCAFSWARPSGSGCNPEERIARSVRPLPTTPTLARETWLRLVGPIPRFLMSVTTIGSARLSG